MYDIRSIAIHGGDWVKRINNKLNLLYKKGYCFKTPFDLMNYLNELVRKIIQIILNQDLTILEFKNKMNNDPFYFFENYIKDIIFKEKVYLHNDINMDN